MHCKNIILQLFVKLFYYDHCYLILGLLDTLGKMNDKMEAIQRALEQYLETKRHIFPRFYFISNDDLLEILGNSKKPELVQPHFKKLFDNINKVSMVKTVSHHLMFQ